MGRLINGKWENADVATRDNSGQFIRSDSIFRNWITQDPTNTYQPEPNRYHLYISYACPWACRTLIVRKLRGLDDIISFSTVEPLMREKGWEFAPDSGDPINHAQYLYEIYLKSKSDYSGKVTVPVLWDKKTNSIVNNESSEIIRMLNSEFNEFAKNNLDFYPAELRNDIDDINALVYENINNGVYKCGFAGAQSAYDEAFDHLFSALETLENKLAKQRYLVDNRITEADWRLFTTLIRFDVVYYVHFKCNLKRIVDYPNLSNYLRDLYQQPGVKETVNFPHIKEHYYRSHTSINPSGIVPKGPEIDFDAPHDRESYSSSP